MILVDTPIWIDHFRSANATLTMLLERQRVLMHPLVLGELAMSNLQQRATILDALGDLPGSAVAEDHEVLGFVERFKIFGRGVSIGEAHLLASAKLASARFWTRDKRLQSVAWALGLASDLS